MKPTSLPLTTEERQKQEDVLVFKSENEKLKEKL